ncbi:chaperone protein ClpB1-like [Triticum dicoccoides]|uniref:chaperone protein ClpB1-like n=1 Tax=Triticum dicoccoides TaxID=85692 RepID=UPI00188E6FA0|nr:chaperone protein ClpB1-like [Triticum dicoccoides]
MSRASCACQVYDPVLGTYVPRASSSSTFLGLALEEIKVMACVGATAAVCYGAWRYYRYKTCLRTYGRDMTAVTAGEADPVVGRDDEIDRVVRILCRRTKNCAALVGAAGVGKTAIAEGLAQRIAEGKVPKQLAGARLVEVDLAAMVSGTSWRGMFEERMKNVINSAEASNGKIILFIDEMHTLIGAGDYQRRNDAANMLKPALARGRIRCVGATTFDEYRKHIEKDPALERRFQKVHVDEPSEQATIGILRGLKQRYEEHHSLEIQDAAIVAAAQLAGRYVTGRQFPDKGIDLIDEACTSLEGSEMIIGPDHIAQVVSRWTGIPIATLDQEEKVKLVHLAHRLHERVVGQYEAVNLVADAVLCSRAGLDHPGQPIGSFLFVGPTGVGKTELAKALAEQLFDDEKMLIRFDMSEYVSPGSVLRLIGAPPSYYGYEEGGQLTEKVRRQPYSVILFDEVEKAHHSVLNVLLQLLDDGVLTDGKGRNVDFKNTVIIMTSNVGAEHITPRIAGENVKGTARDLLMKQVREYFKPELLNRLSEVVVFEPLLQHELKEVVSIQMKSIIARVARKDVSLVFSDDVPEVILSESYDQMYGARPIKRWVQKNIMISISKMLVKGEADKGSTIFIDAAIDWKGLEFRVVNKNNNVDAGGKRNTYD